MLAPIPQCLLADSMTLFVCTGMDVWQNPSWDTYAVSNVHLQNSNEVRKSADNTEVVLRAVLFIDAVRSMPQLDYGALAAQSEQSGKPLRCTVSNAAGDEQGSFEVLVVDLVPNVPATGIHHIELGLV